MSFIISFFSYQCVGDYVIFVAPLIPLMLALLFSLLKKVLRCGR